MFILSEFLSPKSNTDPNIPETGEQLAKSNNGPYNCCYEYRDPNEVYKGVYANCDQIESTPTDNPTEIQLSQKNLIDVTNELKQQYDSSSVTKLEIPPQTCEVVPSLSLTTSKCEIPYYASSFDATHFQSTATSTPITVTTSLIAEGT